MTAVHICNATTVHAECQLGGGYGGHLCREGKCEGDVVPTHIYTFTHVQMFMHTDVNTYTHECTAVASHHGTLPDACLPVQTLERAPVAPSGDSHVLFEQFWLEKGPIALPDQPSADGKLPMTIYDAVLATAV